jgi:hypothetical protein
MKRDGSGKVQSRFAARPISRLRWPANLTLTGAPFGRLSSFSIVKINAIQGLQSMEMAHFSIALISKTV